MPESKIIHRCFRTTAEQQQLTLLASCIMLTLRRYTHESPGSQYFPKLELDSTSSPPCQPPRPMLIQTLIPKMKPFLASPNETIEAVSQKLKLKMASVKRDTNCPKRKEMLRRQKKNSQWMCPTTLLQMLSQPRRMSSIKFHSSTSEARDSLHASSCQNRRSYTVFFVSCWHWGGTLMSLQDHNTFQSLN